MLICLVGLNHNIYLKDEAEEDLSSLLASIRTIVMYQGSSWADSPTDNILPMDHWMWNHASKSLLQIFDNYEQSEQHCL